MITEIYTYKDGLLSELKIIVPILIYAFISMIIALNIGINKRDSIAILVTNIMIKTSLMFLCQLHSWLNLDYFNILIYILFFISDIIIEGYIYIKVIKYKKFNGITVSTICNVGTLVIFFLLVIFGERMYKFLFESFEELFLIL